MPRKQNYCSLVEIGSETEAIIRRKYHFIEVEWIRRGITYKRRIYEPQFIELSSALADLLVMTIETEWTSLRLKGKAIKERDSLISEAQKPIDNA